MVTVALTDRPCATVAGSTTRYSRLCAAARTRNVARRAPFRSRACTLCHRVPVRTCSTTAFPGDASGLPAVSTAACPPGPLAALADTGGTTMTSTGRLSSRPGPASRNPAFLVRSVTVTTALPSAPVVAEPTACQERWPACRSCRLSRTPGPARPRPVSRPVNFSLPPATIRPLAAVTDSASGPAARGGLEAEAEEPGCGEAGAGDCAPPGACDLPRPRPGPAGWELVVAGPE